MAFGDINLRWGRLVGRSLAGVSVIGRGGGRQSPAKPGAGFSHGS